MAAYKNILIIKNYKYSSRNNDHADGSLYTFVLLDGSLLSTIAVIPLVRLRSTQPLTRLGGASGQKSVLPKLPLGFSYSVYRVYRAYRAYRPYKAYRVYRAYRAYRIYMGFIAV